LEIFQCIGDFYNSHMHSPLGWNGLFSKTHREPQNQQLDEWISWYYNPEFKAVDAYLFVLR